MWFCAYSRTQEQADALPPSLSRSVSILCQLSPFPFPLPLPTSSTPHFSPLPPSWPHPPHLCLPHPPLAYLPLPSSGPQGLTSALLTCPSSILGYSHLPTSGHHPAFLTFELLVPFPFPPLDLSSGLRTPSHFWPSSLSGLSLPSLPTSGILPSPLVPPHLWPILHTLILCFVHSHYFYSSPVAVCSSYIFFWPSLGRFRLWM
ncbi:hypothetical protein EV363DRAFT_139437 [Boletus edulis]|nr:hypothetical protein EV363DRAFT_139437 [Boletus edulis]